MNTQRKPTVFELRVLRFIARDRLPLGDGRVHYVAAARRLERLGYATKGYSWYVTDKGKAHLSSN